MKIKVTSLSVLLVSVFLLSALFGIQVAGVESAEGAYDWPMFGYNPQRTGYTESPAPNTNQTLWTSNFGGMAGSHPAVADDMVYISAWNSLFYCFDATTGTQIWNYTSGDMTASSPAVADGKVFVGSDDDNLYCLNATTGEKIWNYTTGGDVVSCPVVVDGKVYVGSKDSNLYCLSVDTGLVEWNYTTGAMIELSSPAVADGKVYIGSDDNKTYCLDAANGDFIWSYLTGDQIWSSPTVADGRIYVGSADDNVYCLNATTGEQIWNYTTGDDIGYSSPAVAYGKIYVGSYDANVYCLDAETGGLIWNYTTGGQVWGAPTVADGKVYVGSYDNKFYCLDATDGTLIWSYTTGNIVLSSPVVANGVAYALSADQTVYAFAAEPPLSGAAWSKTYGGTGEDTGQGETVQTSDGGYAIAGDTNSSGAGGMDLWLVKTDADGNMQWNQTFGGALDESAMDMTQTSDGGYIISGSTYSFGAGGQDVYLVKTDADGNMEWNQTYGGTEDDFGHPVIQTSDGGYLVLGTTASFGAGDDDAWLIKTDADGNMQWNQTYGGTYLERGRGLLPTSDGGFAMTAITASFGAGGRDTWLIKTDADGNMQWNQTYGETGNDLAMCLIQSDDGGYAMAGYTTSFGSYKIYLIKADASGNMQWNKTYAPTTVEIGIHGIQTADGGYAIAGWNYVNGQDFTLHKMNATGDLEWTKSYGGTGIENAYALLQTDDGGYLLTGNTNSFGAGGTDVWLVKVDGSGVIPESFTITIVVLLSTVSVAVSFWLLRKKPKLKNSLLKKP